MLQYIKTIQAEKIIFDIKVIQALAAKVVHVHIPESERFEISRWRAQCFSHRHGVHMALVCAGTCD